MQRERFFIFFFTLIFLFISFNSFAQSPASNIISPSPVINDTINAQWQC
jgi:hypothetical protein